MIALVQRVDEAKVVVGNDTISSIGKGILILLGINKGDTEQAARRLAGRCVQLRIFEDSGGKFNRCLLDVKGAALVVSQFTLVADTSRGRRPSFSDAEEPLRSKELYELFIESIRDCKIETGAGIFGERMHIALVNNGPVTIIMEE
ncbi:D-tyrosyl-tRNA(Tyr) deacylase [candidate division WOR-3 bacterium]|nr:D-tyrosyl-tRNA(Tyr) deacylase [candidate division WOR-3 bacterium]